MRGSGTLEAVIASCIDEMAVTWIIAFLGCRARDVPMAASEWNAVSVCLIRPVIARVIVERVVFVIPLHARTVGSIDERKAALCLRALARYEREPNRKTAAGALAAGRRVDV